MEDANEDQQKEGRDTDLQRVGSMVVGRPVAWRRWWTDAVGFPVTRRRSNRTW